MNFSSTSVDQHVAHDPIELAILRACLHGTGNGEQEPLFMCILADFVRPDKFLSLLLADFACLDDGHRAEFVLRMRLDDIHVSQ